MATKPPLDWVDIVERALWTAIEAAVGIVTAAILADVTTNQVVQVENGVWWAAGATAFATFVSVIKNIVVQKRANGKSE